MSGTCLGHLLLVCLSLLDVELLKYCPPLALKPLKPTFCFETFVESFYSQIPKKKSRRIFGWSQSPRLAFWKRSSWNLSGIWGGCCAMFSLISGWWWHAGKMATARKPFCLNSFFSGKIYTFTKEYQLHANIWKLIHCTSLLYLLSGVFASWEFNRSSQRAMIQSKLKCYKSKLYEISPSHDTGWRALFVCSASCEIKCAAATRLDNSTFVQIKWNGLPFNVPGWLLEWPNEVKTYPFFEAIFSIQTWTVEVQSQQMTFTHRIPTYYLIFAVNKSLSRKYTRILQITLLDIDPGEEMEVLLRLMCADQSCRVTFGSFTTMRN